MVKKARAARELLEKKTLELDLLFGITPPEAHAGLFEALQSTYSLVTAVDASQEFLQNTDRIRRGVVAFAAKLQDQDPPAIPEGQGFTEPEWPGAEQELWDGIKKIIARSGGDYGDRKDDIQAKERLLLHAQDVRENRKYIRFVFNEDLKSPERSLTSLLRKHEGDLDKIKFTIDQIAETEDPRKKEILNNLRGQHLWGKVMSVFILGLDQAQTQGWSNWVRTCFVAGYLDSSASFTLYQNAQVKLLEAHASQQNAALTQ